MADDQRVKTSPAPYNLEDFSNLAELPYSVLYRQSGRDAESYPFTNRDNSHFVEVMPTGLVWRHVKFDLNPRLRLITNQDGSVSIMPDSLPKTGFFQEADLDFDRLTGWGFTAAHADATEEDLKETTFRKPEKIEYELIFDGDVNSPVRSNHSVTMRCGEPIVVDHSNTSQHDNLGFWLVPKKKFNTKNILGDDTQKKYPQLNVDYIVGLIHPAGSAGGQITSFNDWIHLIAVYNPLDPTRGLIGQFLYDVFTTVVDATPKNLRDLTKLRLLLALTAAGVDLMAPEQDEMHRLAELLLSGNQCDAFTQEVLTQFAVWGWLDIEVVAMAETEVADVTATEDTDLDIDQILEQFTDAYFANLRGESEQINVLKKSLIDRGSVLTESERIPVPFEELNFLLADPLIMTGFLPYPGEFPNQGLMGEWRPYPYVIDVSDDTSYQKTILYLTHNTNITTGPLEFVDWLRFQITDNADRLTRALDDETNVYGGKLGFLQGVPTLIQYFDNDFLYNDTAWRTLLNLAPDMPEVVFYAYSQAYSHAGRDIPFGIVELWQRDVNRDHLPEWDADHLMLLATLAVNDTTAVKDHHAIIKEAVSVLSGNYQDETRLVFPFLYELVYAMRSADPVKMNDVLAGINDRYLVPLGYAIELVSVRNAVNGNSYLPIPVRISATQSRHLPNFPSIHTTAYYVDMVDEEFPELYYLDDLDGVETLLNSHADPVTFLKRYKKDHKTKTFAGPIINRDFVRLVARDTVKNLHQNPFKNIVAPNLSEEDAYKDLLTDCAAHETAHIEDVAVQQALQKENGTVPDFNEIYATLLGIAGCTNPKLALVLRADLFVHDVNGQAVLDIGGALSRHGIGATYFFIQLAREMGLMTSDETFVTMHSDLENSAARFDAIIKELAAHLAALSGDEVCALAARYADEYREFSRD